MQLSQHWFCLNYFWILWGVLAFSKNEQNCISLPICVTSYILSETEEVKKKNWKPWQFPGFSPNVLCNIILLLGIWLAAEVCTMMMTHRASLLSTHALNPIMQLHVQFQGMYVAFIMSSSVQFVVDEICIISRVFTTRSGFIAWNESKSIYQLE